MTVSHPFGRITYTMSADTLVELLIAKLLASWSGYGNDSLKLSASNDAIGRDRATNFTPGLFNAEFGKFRLLQPIWDLRIGYENYVSSALFPIIVCVSYYFLLMIPFTIADLYGSNWKWLQQYKIQPDRKVTWPAVRNAIVYTVWNHLIFILPISIAQYVWTPPTELPALAPGLWEFCWQQYASLAIFDFEYYVWHYLHHRFRWLYRHVHSIHHHYSRCVVGLYKIYIFTCINESISSRVALK